MEKVQCGKRVYQVISVDLTKEKLPNFYKRGCVAVITASFGETLFSIYEFANGDRKALRAFV